MTLLSDEIGERNYKVIKADSDPEIRSSRHFPGCPRVFRDVQNVERDWCRGVLVRTRGGPSLSTGPDPRFHPMSKYGTSYGWGGGNVPLVRFPCTSVHHVVPGFVVLVRPVPRRVGRDQDGRAAGFVVSDRPSVPRHSDSLDWLGRPGMTVRTG